VRVLRGFEKVSVQPGTSVEVVFEIMRRDLSFWDIEAQDWRIPSGRVEMAVGLSSRDIKGTVSVSIV
jgi:beta-glucosidase